MVSGQNARTHLSAHGRCEAQGADDWTGDVALPEALRAFYTEVGPRDVTVESVGSAIHFPSLAKLWDFQTGYRWNGVTGEAVADWPDAWLVIAGMGGDPFIYDAESGQILYAMHGMGSWDDADAVFPDSATLAAVVAVLGGVVDATDQLLDDETFELLPAAIERARAALTALLDDPGTIEMALSIFGWE